MQMQFTMDRRKVLLQGSTSLELQALECEGKNIPKTLEAK